MITDNGKKIHLKRELNVPVAKLYEAWTKPEVFTAWWKDLEVAEMDFRKGGKYRMAWVGGDEVVGEYREIQPEKKIVMTWLTNGDCQDKSQKEVYETMITLNFKKISDQKSEFELIHEGLRDNKAIDSHHWGWTHALYNFDDAYERPQFEHNGKLEVTKVLNAPVEKVYAAWTQTQFLNAWFNKTGSKLGRSTCDLKIGGNLVLDFEMKTGEILRHYAQFREIVPNHKLAFDWITDYCPYETYLTVEFRPQGKQTEVKIFHKGFRDEKMSKDHTEGWTDCMRSMNEELTKLA